MDIFGITSFHGHKSEVNRCHSPGVEGVPMVQDQEYKRLSPPDLNPSGLVPFPVARPDHGEPMESLFDLIEQLYDYDPRSLPEESVADPSIDSGNINVWDEVQDDPQVFLPLDPEPQTPQIVNTFDWTSENMLDLAPSQSTQMELCDKASKKRKRTEEDSSASMTDGRPAAETRDPQPNAAKRPKPRHMVHCLSKEDQIKMLRKARKLREAKTLNTANKVQKPVVEEKPAPVSPCPASSASSQPAAPPQAAPETCAQCVQCSGSSEELTLEFRSIIGADVQMDPFKAWLLEMFGQVAKTYKVRVMERAKRCLRVLGFLDTEEMDIRHLVESLMSHVPKTFAIRHMEIFNHYFKTIRTHPPPGSRRKRQLINQPDDCSSYNCHQHAPMYASQHKKPYTAPQFQPQPPFMPTYMPTYMPLCMPTHMATYMPPCMPPWGQLNAPPYTRLHTLPDTHPQDRKQPFGRFQEPNTWTQDEQPTAFGLFKQLEWDNVKAEVKIQNKTLINAVLQDKWELSEVQS
uniref:Uncharacterized protein n=1 Tax=Knipowitschia caucasica TaxID=637954 RepID=A0AAV2JQC4_KNICA